MRLIYKRLQVDDKKGSMRASVSVSHDITCTWYHRVGPWITFTWLTLTLLWFLLTMSFSGDIAFDVMLSSEYLNLNFYSCRSLLPVIFYSPQCGFFCTQRQCLLWWIDPVPWVLFALEVNMDVHCEKCNVNLVKFAKLVTHMAWVN